MAFKVNLTEAAVLGLLILVCLDVIHGFQIPDGITGKPGVGIINLAGGPATVHCESKEDNLGTRVMQENEEWKWRFHPNFGGTTLWWCSFNWNALSSCFTVWDINSVPQYDATINSWRIMPEGFLLYDPVKSVWNRIYNWGNPCRGPTEEVESSFSKETESEVTNLGVTTGF